MRTMTMTMTDKWKAAERSVAGLTRRQLVIGGLVTTGCSFLFGVFVLLGVPNFLHSIEIARSFWGV